MYFTTRLTTAADAVVVYEYVSTERGAPSALLSVSRPEPAPADCGLATKRRATHRPRVGREATSLCIQLCRLPTHRSFFCCFAVVGNILNLETM